MSVLPSLLNSLNLRAAGCLDRVCLLPKPLNERLSYLGDALVQMVRDASKDTDLRFVVGRLCQTLSYMLNSTSWREGKLHSFDVDEVRRKVKILTQLKSGGEE